MFLSSLDVTDLLSAMGQSCHVVVRPYNLSLSYFDTSLCLLYRPGIKSVLKEKKKLSLISGIERMQYCL